MSIGSSFAGTVPVPAPPSASLVASHFGAGVCWWSALLILFVPFLACFGFDRERRYWPNGVFSVRNVLDGTPAGGLPYLWALMACGVLGFALGADLQSGSVLQWQYWSCALFMVGFWTFFWAVGRLTSSFFGGLKSARALLFAAFLLIVVLPYPFLTFAQGPSWDEEINRGAWNFYALSPLTAPPNVREGQTVLFAIVFFVLALVCASFAERRVKARMAVARRYDERSFQTT